MRTLVAKLTLICILTYSCTDNSRPPDEMRQVSVHDDKTLPIHGTLTQKQIDRYFPNIFDTIRDRRILGSEPIDIKTNEKFHVSMLHNTGTFDQMFLCTHDENFNLIDSYYIGTATEFDGTSHTIEYKITGDGRLEFHHVEWGWVNTTGEKEIDTLNYTKYILKFSETGKITRK